MTQAGLISSATILCLLILASLAEAGEPIPPQPTKPDGSPNRAVWVAQGPFGVMTHYLIQPKGATPQERTADLNGIINQFDVDRYVRQIEDTGADWVIFTLGQTTGYLCSPNEYLDSRAPGAISHLILAPAQRGPSPQVLPVPPANVRQDAACPPNRLLAQSD